MTDSTSHRNDAIRTFAIGSVTVMSSATDVVARVDRIALASFLSFLLFALAALLAVTPNQLRPGTRPS